MSSKGLRSIVVKKYRPNSSKSSAEEKENLLNRDFKAKGINQKWCTDILLFILSKMDGLIWLQSWIFIAEKLLAMHITLQ